MLFPLLGAAPEEQFRPVAAEEMELVRQGVRHNEALIRDARMVVNIEILKRDPRTFSSRVKTKKLTYLREFGSAAPRFRLERVWESEDGDVLDRYGSFFDGEKQCNLALIPGRPETDRSPRASILGEPSYIRDQTPDQFSLLDTFGIDSDPKPLSARLATNSARLLGRQEYDGADCYVVEVMRDGGCPKRVWLDPQRGFSILRTESYATDDNGKLDRRFSVHEDIVLKEVAPDTWFPVAGTHRWFSNDVVEGGKVVGHTDEYYEENVKRITVKELEINLDLTDDDFSFELPEGTKVFDSRFDWGYTVGEAASNRLQEELEAEAAVAAEDFEPLPPPIETQEAPSEVAAPSGAQPAQEESAKPKPAPRHDGAGSSIAWAGGLAGAVVLAGLVLVFWRRRNAQRPN